MTTTVTTASSGPLTANGVTPIPFTFQALSAAEIEVVRAGVTAIPSTYTVTLNTDGTGSITPTSTWASDTVTIYSAPTYQQPTNFQRFGAWYPDQLNISLDRQARSLIGLRTYFNRIMGTVQTDSTLSVSLGATPGAGLVGYDNALTYTAGTVGATLRNLLSSVGATLISAIQTGTGAVARTLAAKFGDVLHVKDYGAVCDGIADDTVPAQNAINAGVSQGKTVVFSKTIKHGALIRPAGSHIIGPGSKCTVTLVAGIYATHTITGSDTRTEGFRHEAIAKTGGFEYVIACGTSQLERTTIKDVLTFNARGGISDSGTTGYHFTTVLDHVQFRGHNGPGVAWTRGFGFLECTWTAVDFVGVPTSDFMGFDIDFAGLPAGAGGIEFRQCDVLGTAGTFNLANQQGFRVQNGGSVWFNHTRADTLGGKGYILNNVFKVKFDAEASLCAGAGAEITTMRFASGELNVYGRKGLTYAPVAIDGIRLIGGCYAVNLSGGLTVECTGHGIHKVAAQAGIVTFLGYMSYGNTLRGLKTVGSSAFLYSGSLATNTGGNYDLGAASDKIEGTMLDSAAVVDATGPVVG